MADTFVIDVEQFAAKSISDIDVIRRKTTLEVFSKVVKKTPVDTGRARGNWQTTIGSPASGEIERLDRSGAASVSEVVSVVGRSGLTDVVFLTNNLPYIGVLEYGHSRQAPRGMVRTSIAEFPYIVKRSESGTKYG